MFAWCAARTHVELSHTKAPFSPDASLEVSFPSARANRDALLRAAGPERSRFGVARWLTTRASADLRLTSVAHAVFRFANVNAVVPDAGLVARYLRRVIAASKRLATRLRSSVRALAGVTDASRAHVRSSTSSAAALNLPFADGHAPAMCFFAVFRYRPCELSRPG